MIINRHELFKFASQVLEKPECLDPVSVSAIYKQQGLEVIPNPYSAIIVNRAINALQINAPFSAIRIGDGEANLLTHGAYKTPKLDWDSCELILSMQSDKLDLTDRWCLHLKKMMHVAIAEADLLGVRGLWLAKGNPTRKQSAQDYCDKIFKSEPSGLRGLAGVWRATDYMLQLAKTGSFTHKIICSAHFYLSILCNLEQLLSSASEVYLITDQKEAHNLLIKNFPRIRFGFIPVGALRNLKQSTSTQAKQGSFLGAVFREIPKDSRGILFLVGAGIWAEIYCTWIRRRGGVAIDIGSGMDLLIGKCTRPAHFHWGFHDKNPYALR